MRPVEGAQLCEFSEVSWILQTGDEGELNCVYRFQVLLRIYFKKKVLLIFDYINIIHLHLKKLEHTREISLKDHLDYP